MPACLPVYLSVCLPVCLLYACFLLSYIPPANLSHCLSVCLPTWLTSSVYKNSNMRAFLAVCLFFGQPVYLPVCLLPVHMHPDLLACLFLLSVSMPTSLPVCLLPACMNPHLRACVSFLKAGLPTCLTASASMHPQLPVYLFVCLAFL